MNKVAYLTVFAAIVLSTGCKVSSSNSDSRPPELEAFHMVDSYGVATDEDPFTQLALNPYKDNGLFEVFWYVNNEDDYIVELSINDKPELLDRVIISTDRCGPGLECDLDGTYFCEYNDDDTVSCDPPSEEFPGQSPADIHDLFVGYPQTMYFILDICDTRSDICEYQVLDVSME